MKRIFTPGYVVYVVLLLAGATAAYRILAPGLRPLTIEDMARPDYQDSPDRLMRKIDRDGLLHDLRPHAKATHDGISYATNNDGLREDHDYALEKAPGVRRVILLGDSFVFGWGLHLEHTMGRQTASLLDGTKWEVLNLGVPAYNTANEVSFLEERGLKYHPDVVVLMYHPNDAGIATNTVLGDAATTDRLLTDYYDGKGTPEQRAQVEDYLGSEGQPLAPSWNAPDLRSRDRQYLTHHFLPLYWSQVQQTLDRLATLAREHHFAVVVAILPELDRPWEKHPFAPLYAHVHDEMARRGFEVVDLYPLFQRYPNPDLMLWGHDGHTSAFANRLIAHALAERLQAAD
jgi:lysophospholipase L1-like esterase